MLMSTDITTWRVLIVDDEPDNLDLASDLLTYCGAEVAPAGTGELALALLETFAPNVILLDLAMPGLDGWTIQQELRARPEYNHIVIIALTALVMPHDADRIQEACFDGYIVKPFRVRTLLEDIAACIERFQGNHTRGTREE